MTTTKRFETAHNGDALCPTCGGVGAASCICPSAVHDCEEHLVEVGTSPDFTGHFSCWDRCEICGAEFHHRTDSVC